MIFFVVRLSVNDCNNTITHGWFVCVRVLFGGFVYVYVYDTLVLSRVLLLYCSLFVVCEQNVVLYWGEENNWTQYLISNRSTGGYSVPKGQILEIGATLLLRALAF